MFKLKTRENYTYKPEPSTPAWSNSKPLWTAEDIPAHQKETGWVLFDLPLYQTPASLSFNVIRHLRGDEKIKKLGVPIDLLEYGTIETKID